MDKKIVSYVKGGLTSFDLDPADSSFQEGYKAALEDVLAYSKTIEKE